MRGLMDSWRDWKTTKRFVPFQEARTKIFPVQTPSGKRGREKKPVEVFSVEGLFVPYRVKVATDEGSSLHLFPRREQEDPSISSATKDWPDSQRPRWEKPISLLAPEKCRGMKREIEVNRGTGGGFFFSGFKEGSWAQRGLSHRRRCCFIVFNGKVSLHCPRRLVYRPTLAWLRWLFSSFLCRC